MWPILLDMTKDDCKRMLRRLELEAYGNLVSALRAQGGLSSEKHKLLQEISSTLNIPQERHRAEIRRAVNDERLATIAYCMTGDDTTDEWALEGRRLVPLMPRLVPQTAFSVIADDEANKACIDNEKLPTPSSTERKRSLQTNTSDANKNIQYATSEFTSKHANQSNIEDANNKKRRPSINMESSSIAQHLIMGPPKISRVQQLYRQKTKAILKAQMKQRTPSTQHITNVQKTNRKIEEEIKNISSQHNAQTSSVQKLPIENKNINNPTVAANITVSNENNIPHNKSTVVQATSKPAITCTNAVKVQAPGAVNATEVTPKSIKICPARKALSASSRAQTQKLIIVSNSQGSTTSSILQRTLTIPFVKTISMKNLDKLKVINSSSCQSSPSSNMSTTTTNQKPKLLTVHTKMKSNTPGKPINIPFIQGVQLQALQNKGAIKMVPLSTTTKMTSKSAIINTTSGSVYIMNSNANISAVTASNSTPIMTSKAQTDQIQDNHRNVYILKNEEIKPAVSIISNNVDNMNNQNVVVLNVQSQKVEPKSSVLTEILKASGVIPNDEGDVLQDHCDIESQISQLTEIPNSGEIEETIINCIPDICETVESADMEMVETIESQEMEHYNDMIGDVSTVAVSGVNESDYVILQDGGEEMVVCDVENESQNTGVLEMMGCLDPETGMYSLQAPEIEEIVENEQDPSNSYIIDMEAVHSSELDMPNLSLH